MDLAGRRILIVGGGIGGMAAAIRFGEAQADVTLIDIDPNWRVYGAGITITGPTLRAYRRLGLLEQIREKGAITNGSRIFRYDGLLLHDLDEPVLEEGLPATGGIMRPVLHHIMQSRVRELGVTVRLGMTVMELKEWQDGTEAVFSDGYSERFDLIVGADSIYSGVRRIAFPHMGEAAPTGQGAFRVSMKRPPDVERGEFYFGHRYPVGITCCAPNSCYLYLLPPHEYGDRILGDDEVRSELREKLADFGGNAGWIRDHMTDSDWVNYRPLAAALQPRPWYKGHIVLLGDAVHATTPHLASGAGMAVESALVLVEELARASHVTEGLQAYEDRRFDRCKHVVVTSLAIGRIQLSGGPAEDAGALLSGALHRLAEEY